MKTELLALTLGELQEFLAQGSFPKFRAKQLMDYIYKRHISDFNEMLQFPEGMREWLEAQATITVPLVKDVKRTDNGDTVKLLLELSDNSLVEAVLMKQYYGNSVCVSSQVGCAMGCIFCASTREGLLRNLEPYEIVGQIVAFANILQEDIHSVVVMGAGEPLQNYDHVIQALRFIHEKESYNIGYRRITLSTCGIIEEITRLAQENLPITLALSLHAPNDTIRNTIMPISRQYRLADVMKAVKFYFESTGRRITFEYILIDGVNASEQNARELAALLKGFPNCNVNLIPVNGNEHIHLVKPTNAKQKQFVRVLEDAGLTVVIRKEMGDSIQAACGQLKVQYNKGNESGKE